MRFPDIRGYEVVWTDSLGAERRILCMDLDRAEMFAVRYRGVVHALVRDSK